MADNKIRIECSNCGNKFPAEIIQSETSYPCPKCGSTTKRIKIILKDDLQLYDNLKFTSYDPTLPSKTKRKKTQVECFTGTEWSHSRKKMVNKYRLIDRRNDLYIEWVIDPDTGEIIHSCEEPLSHHRGHGDARKDK